MQKVFLAVHLVFVGIWLGCVLTEGLFERALVRKGRALGYVLARLHMRVDLFVEIPALVAVVVTGAFLLANANPSPLLYLKIGFGLLGVIANVYCVWLVFRRLRTADVGHWREFSRFDRPLHKFGTVVLIGILVALGIGVFL